jgi:hypothetical protein
VFSSLISSHDWSSAVPRASSAVRATVMSFRRLYSMRWPSSAIFRRRSSALARMLTIWEFIPPYSRLSSAAQPSRWACCSRKDWISDDCGLAHGLGAVETDQQPFDLVQPLVFGCQVRDHVNEMRSGRHRCRRPLSRSLVALVR